jgi:quinolinate synthase
MSTKEALIQSIINKKKERNAVILAHNYQLPEVQDIADFSGDSLELARKAETLDAEVVVFCGVHFMAETAAILSPEKIVLLPDASSGCPMADMLDADTLAKLQAEHPGAVTVCYVNSTAEVKALSDVCCTSANAPDVVAGIPADREVLFVPDQYLGGHVERTLKRTLIKYPGYCPTHARLLPEHIALAKKAYPGAPVMVHPESRAETCLAADAVLSTGGMCKFAAKSAADTFIVGTETGLIHRLQKENPNKKFVPLLEQAVCLNMKQNNLEKILLSLETLAPRVTVPEEIANKAKRAVVRMLHGYTPGKDEVSRD